MSGKRKAIATILFAALSIVSVSALVYSSQSYFGVYRATRMLTMAIEDFDITILNATYAYTETHLTFDNPSEIELHSLIIEQRLDLNEEYFAFSRAPNPTTLHPLRLLPQSRTNMTLRLEVPQQKMPLLQSTTEKHWLVTITVVCEGPIVERFSIGDYASFITD